MQIVKVHMLAFEEEYCVREVTIPDEVAVSLGNVFQYGQNEFAVGPEKNTTCSVSAGDVIELNGFHLLLPVGLKELTAAEFEEYKQTPRRERFLFCRRES